MHYQGLCEVLVAQLCLTFCDPMDYSPPGSSVHVPGESQGRGSLVGAVYGVSESDTTEVT